MCVLLCARQSMKGILVLVGRNLQSRPSRLQSSDIGVLCFVWYNGTYDRN
jgi:hypothetical protein